MRGLGVRARRRVRAGWFFALFLRIRPVTKALGFQERPVRGAGNCVTSPHPPAPEEQPRGPCGAAPVKARVGAEGANNPLASG
ncbi:hypothetical protein GCM10011579_052140 [Streptomyces albiflavescens]|uniref:Uncharacterized protein n=1 Tax=Streptomyces albiflavescens TaxID=1623582 RepID=A0A917Y8Z2_9ACTN|nr:hypothetical protein GCM10011579_052140 [Streptomyces albiflavescens]